MRLVTTPCTVGGRPRVAKASANAGASSRVGSANSHPFAREYHQAVIAESVAELLAEERISRRALPYECQ